MPIEAMKAVRGLVVRPSGRHQQAAFSEYLEQAITPHVQLPVRLTVQEMVQLAGTQPRRPLADVANMRLDPIRLLFPAVRRTVTLVIRLATDTHEPASPGDAQPCDVSLREDLPGRFFT